MDKETEGKLLAWEAIAREALSRLSPADRAAVLNAAAPKIMGQPAAIQAGGSPILRSLRQSLTP